MDVTLVRGVHDTFDLRPSIQIESEPTGAIATVTDRAAGDSLRADAGLRAPESWKERRSASLQHTRTP
jgi:hypothetical protein